METILALFLESAFTTEVLLLTLSFLLIIMFVETCFLITEVLSALVPKPMNFLRTMMAFELRRVLRWIWLVLVTCMSEGMMQLITWGNWLILRMARRLLRAWVCRWMLLRLLRSMGLVEAYVMPGRMLKTLLRPTAWGCISWRESRRSCRQVLVMLRGGLVRLATAA